MSNIAFGHHLGFNFGALKNFFFFFREGRLILALYRMDLFLFLKKMKKKIENLTLLEILSVPPLCSSPTHQHTYDATIRALRMLCGIPN